ncbi:MAG: hypothetical protein LBL08_00970 [Candidatus Nomurabacteria bacterium]|jgi:hypothetical protein|nr:hypothetical protein [Candidatus Nomurabacteria bacterium]
MFKKILLSTLAVLLCAVPTFALAAGKIEMGDFYRARNITAGGEFTDPAAATCSQTVQFRARIHNPGPDPLENVTAVATPLSTAEGTSFTSQITLSASNQGNQDPVSDTATVNLDQPGRISYIAGSTELLGQDGGVIRSLGDSIFTSGVNIGSVGVSTMQKRFIQFRAAVDCAPVPPTPEASYVCDRLNIQKLSRINFQFTTDYSLENATYKNVTYQVDGQSHVVTNQNTRYTYQTDVVGKHEVTAYVTVDTAGGVKTTNLCRGEFTVDEVPPTPPEKCTVPGKEDLDADDPNCKPDDPTPEPDKCKVAGKEDLDADDPNCKPDKPISPVVPTNPTNPSGGGGSASGKGTYTPNALPETGAELGGVAGIGSLVTAGAYYIQSRRRLSRM